MSQSPAKSDFFVVVLSTGQLRPFRDELSVSRGFTYAKLFGGPFKRLSMIDARKFELGNSSNQRYLIFGHGRSAGASPKYEDDFAFDIFVGKPLFNFRKRSPNDFFVYLSELAYDNGGAVAKYTQTIRQGFGQPVWAFIEN